MLELRGRADLSNGLRGPLLMVFALIVVACSGSSTPPTASAATGASQAVAPSASPVAAGPTVSPEPASSAGSSPAASAAAAPSGGPVLNPEHCPATLPADSYRTTDGLQIDGDADFIAHVERALDLLKQEAPEPYADVLSDVVMIRQVESFSGMCYNTGSYRVGEETAYAPGHPEDRQVIWLAGTIVHDGCHRARYVQGLPPSGQDAELACLELQAEALRMIDANPYFSSYVQGLIDAVDDPANQYWNDPNRHW